MSPDSDSGIGIGIIGGSGLYDMAELRDREERSIATPFGDPSGPYVTGTLRGKRVAFLARHGLGHRLLPSELNFRANIFGFKVLGVERLLSASAVGSLKEEYKPLDILVPDQFFDRTRGRISTFFGRGLVAHVGFAHPFCAVLSAIAADAVERVGATVHRGGTYVNMEGPQFSTLAESLTYKALGYAVIGMTNMPEAKLAREAEICYATVAMVTDFDCWHPDHDAVTVQDVVKVLGANADRAKRLVARLARDFPREHEACPIGSDRALDHAIITAPEARDPAVLAKLDAVAGRLLAAAARMT
jgi:5'-methylthioadenosine phosphorylase